MEQDTCGNRNANAFLHESCIVQIARALNETQLPPEMHLNGSEIISHGSHAPSCKSSSYRPTAKRCASTSGSPAFTTLVCASSTA